MKEAIVRVEFSHGQAYIIEGQECCYKSEEAALRASARVTVRPCVAELIDNNNNRLYLAVGDSYINCVGEGSYLYGKRGGLVRIVSAQPE